MNSLPQLSVKFLFTCLVLFFLSCAKNTAELRRPVGPDENVQIISDVKYGSNKDLQGNTVALALDVYIPANASGSQKFPFVLFVHGGSFSTGDKSSGATSMKKFVDAGYVAASINYRVDSSLDASTDPCNIDTNTTKKAVYMAVQDLNAAMRFMIANAVKYHIDVSRIFLNGASAGAITVLNTYFLTQSDFNVISPGIQAQLGGVNNADNNLTNTFAITAIAANSGCLPNPAYINSLNAIPVIFFHSGQDSVIPVDHGPAYYCPNNSTVYGSIPLYNRMVSLGEPSVLHIDPEGQHSSYAEDFVTSNEICFFNSVMNKKTESGSFAGQASSCQ